MTRASVTGFAASFLLVILSAGCSTGDESSSSDDETVGAVQRSAPATDDTAPEGEPSKRTTPDDNDGTDLTTADDGIPPTTDGETDSSDRTDVVADSNPETHEDSDLSDETVVGDAASEETNSLEDQLSAYAIPPDWIAEVEPRWDVNKPWKEARLEIRRLLGTNVEVDRREAIKLLWEYHRKNDIGDGHEYGFDLYLGGEALWAILAYRDWLPQNDEYLFVRGWTSLASLYVQYDEFEQAEKTLETLMEQVPNHEFPTMRRAEVHDAFGDLYVAWGKVDTAKDHYKRAAKLYPMGKPRYGRHLLPRRAKKVQAKLDLLSYGSLAGESLRDGRFQAKALGYSGDIGVTVQVKGGRVADVRVSHQEKIDQNACVIIPRRIVEQQSLRVDGITGATITKDAIVGGTFRALKQAGLR